MSSIFNVLKKIGLLLLLVAICPACRPPEQDKRTTLLVAAASDLVKALPELGRDFEVRTGGSSGVKIVPSFGASGILARQIAHGAPFDVFLSADRRHIEELVRDGRVEAGSRRVYARGRLVLWSAKLSMSSLEDLRRPEVQRISMANPGYAPYGRAARQALEKAGLWPQVAPKVVVAESIRHALEMAESGNVEIAMTALSLAPAGGSTWLVPESLHDPIEQEAAIVKPSSGAQKFLKYLTSPAARTILKKYGFTFPAT